MSIEDIEMDKKNDDEYGQKGKFSDWEISDAASTLERAEEIKQDPELLKYVKKCLSSKVKSTKKTFNSIQDLRDYANERDDDEE